MVGPLKLVYNGFKCVTKCKKLTHGGDHVSCCTLVIREPEGCKLGGGKNDEGLTQGTKRLTQHDNSIADCGRFSSQRSTDAHQGTNHAQPGTQNQLQVRGEKKGSRNRNRNHSRTQSHTTFQR